MPLQRTAPVTILSTATATTACHLKRLLTTTTILHSLHPVAIMRGVIYQSTKRSGNLSTSARAHPHQHGLGPVRATSKTFSPKRQLPLPLSMSFRPTTPPPSCSPLPLHISTTALHHTITTTALLQQTVQPMPLLSTTAEANHPPNDSHSKSTTMAGTQCPCQQQGYHLHDRPPGHPHPLPL